MSGNWGNQLLEFWDWNVILLLSPEGSSLPDNDVAWICWSKTCIYVSFPGDKLPIPQALKHPSHQTWRLELSTDNKPDDLFSFLGEDAASMVSRTILKFWFAWPQSSCISLLSRNELSARDDGSLSGPSLCHKITWSCQVASSLHSLNCVFNAVSSERTKIMGTHYRFSTLSHACRDFSRNWNLLMILRSVDDEIYDEEGYSEAISQLIETFVCFFFFCFSANWPLCPSLPF